MSRSLPLFRISFVFHLGFFSSSFEQNHLGKGEKNVARTKSQNLWRLQLCFLSFPVKKNRKLSSFSFSFTLQSPQHRTHKTNFENKGCSLRDELARLCAFFFSLRERRKWKVIIFGIRRSFSFFPCVRKIISREGRQKKQRTMLLNSFGKT